MREISDNKGNIIIIKKDDVSFKSKSKATNNSNSLGETSSIDNSISQNDDIVNIYLCRTIKKNIPQAVNDPIMVFQSATVDNAFVVLTELKDKSENDVVMAIHMNKIKSQDRSQSRGLQLPKLADTTPDKDIILYKDNIVNSYSMKKSKKNYFG